MNSTEDINVTSKDSDSFPIFIHDEEEYFSFRWFINASEISPGASAIIGDNRVAFYAIHHLALCTITISLVASIVVVFQIHSKWRRHTSKLDFPIRFPLYLAIADALWGLSHFTDHMYLVTVQKFPEIYTVKQALSMNLWFFFGYQQLMHASIAGYTYLRVVHSRKLNLGKWEWKLHLLWFSFLASTIVAFRFVDSFGNTGYWMAHDATTINGQILGIVIALTSTFNAFCTTLGYRSIRKTVVKVKSNLKTHVPVNNVDGGQLQGKRKTKKKQQSIASQCLTTYVHVASWLYCPLAVLLWINLSFQIFMNAVEPLSCLLIVIVANCSGWANAYGYFHNERLKKEKEGKVKYTSSAGNSGDKSLESNSSSSEV